MSYTVIGSAIAEAQLADLWLKASDRAALTRSANEIYRLLHNDPTNQAVALSEGLWKLVVLPLAVIFEVREADRIVEVARVRRISAE